MTLLLYYNAIITNESLWLLSLSSLFLLPKSGNLSFTIIITKNTITKKDSYININNHYH